MKNQSCAYCFNEHDHLKEFYDIEGNTIYACPSCLNQELKKHVALLREARLELKSLEKSHQEARVYWYKCEEHFRMKCEDLEKTLRKELCISLPTPKTLRDAISNATQGEGSVSLTLGIERHVRDYLSQKFGVAYFKATSEEITKLQKLWKTIISHE